MIGSVLLIQLRDQVEVRALMLARDAFGWIDVENG